MKRRITRKMRRELKKAVNPLEELLIIIKQYFPKLVNWIDGTELYSTRVNLGEQAITKVYNKDEENEYTLYSYYVLEAKLVCGNMAFSLASEFVENETYTDSNGNTYRKFDKQDCELEAAYRLLNKIKKDFPNYLSL